MLLTIANPTAQTVEAGDFNLSGGIMLQMLLFFFFDMRLPYAFYFTYLNTSLPAGVHKLPNTCTTCVCLMVNTPFPAVHHMSNMLIMYVHVAFYYYLNQ
jgi:hypothetical protein